MARRVRPLEVTGHCTRCGMGWWTPRDMVIASCADCPPEDDDLTTDETPQGAAVLLAAGLVVTGLWVVVLLWLAARGLGWL